MSSAVPSYGPDVCQTSRVPRHSDETDGGTDPLQFAFLLRPCHRLTSLQMQLKRILNSTPPDHPDTEELPTLISVMHRAVQSSQPGIASAEQKLALWNVAEKLLLKRGEMVEMGLAEPKRSLMHAGWVWRRMRGESSWHGW